MTARTEYWNTRFDLSFSRVRLHLQLDDLMRQAEAIAETHRKYAPDQPRIPAGQSGGGQWTSGFEPLIHLAGGFKPEHMQMTVQ